MTARVPKWRYRREVQANLYFQRRRELGLSREECAKRLGISERTLRRLEDGSTGAYPELWRLAYAGLEAELWAEHMARILGLITIRRLQLSGAILTECSVRVEHRDLAEEDPAALAVGEA